MKKIILLFTVIVHFSFGQELKWTSIPLNVKTSIRGMSVVNDSVAWISGSGGYVARTLNGGIGWTQKLIPGFEKSEFRSLYAFSATSAIVANSGSPSNILITNDGGLNWQNVYSNEHKDAFFDGIDFWNDKEGIIYGDPIDGKMLLLRTKDGGQHWEEIKESPKLEEGEASFAASGTGIRCLKKNRLVIATGGKVTRLWNSNDKGLHWSFIPSPIIHGESTTGIFSFSFWNEKKASLVGGDYLKDSLTIDHNFYTLDGGKHWIRPTSPTRGYRECVEYLNETLMIATGPGGTDVSNDGGFTWAPLSDEKSFHVVRKARTGSLVILAGNSKVAILKMK
ncbi:MAG TPA: YCF48-related protein [Chryseolinea sp.]|nr:YCF48-related protein [Chryseolinea sp.]